MDVQRRVDRLRGGERPSNNTTYSTLDRLSEWGLIDKTGGGGTTASYEMTTAGLDLLAQAVASNPA
jgi:DNA-binding PadR family transcriptional regulator